MEKTLPAPSSPSRPDAETGRTVNGPSTPPAGRRGRLKIFLGSAPGVGKTQAMLQSAARRAREGARVVIACVETHGFPETERIAAGMETVTHRRDDGRTDLDTAAILARAPQLVLVDNLAQGVSGPDGKPQRRYQAIQPLLDVGIDVYATLVVQNLESVNDSMARLSGVRLRDTVPDHLIRDADEVELVDLSPEELIERLRAGKVMVGDDIAPSMRRFFSRRNLTVLREAAMRVAADRLNEQASGSERKVVNAERLLVCVNESPVWRRILRAARRVADTQHMPWTVLYVQTRRYEQLDDAARDRIAQAMRLAERWGAEVVTLPGRGRIVDEILEFAERRGATRLLVGRSRRRWLPRLLGRTVDSRLLQEARDLEVTVVIPEEADPGPRLWPADRNALKRVLGSYAVATAAAGAALVFALVLASFMPLHNVPLIFLAGVVLVAVREGLWPSVYASVLGFLAYNFFFTEPNYSLTVTHEEDILTIFFFLAIATLTANLAARVRTQVEEIRLSARRIQNLYDFSRRIVATMSLDDTLWAVVSHVASALGCHAMVLLPGSGGKLEIMSGYPPEDHLNAEDWTAAERAWSQGRAAGWAEPESEGGGWLFIPLRTASGTIGLLGVKFEGHRQHLSPEQRRLLDAVVDQAAVAIERTKLATNIEEARILSETEHLRSALLSSISHDLRTPLVSILGSATTLTNLGDRISPQDRVELTRTILREGERLNRFVQNLLDMTRLGAGALEPRRDWVDLRDILGQAVRDSQPSLEDVRTEVHAEADLPLVYVDPILIGQVVMNLLENSAKHAPLGSAIVIAAMRHGDDVAVTVTDSGPGIPAADRKAVFDMFYRVRAGDSNSSGTGLGLAICKGLVEAHGGMIEALPGPGETGTTVRFLLPVLEMPPLPQGADE